MKLFHFPLFAVVYSFKDPSPWEWEDGNSNLSTQVKTNPEHLSICGIYSAPVSTMQ